MPYRSTSPLDKSTICLVCFKHIELDHFTKLHNLTDPCSAVSWLSYSKWDPSTRQLASILQMIIKESPACTQHWQIWIILFSPEIYSGSIEKVNCGMHEVWSCLTHFENNCMKLFWRFNTYSNMLRYTNN